VSGHYGVPREQNPGFSPFLTGRLLGAVGLWQDPHSVLHQSPWRPRWQNWVAARWSHFLGSKLRKEMVAPFIYFRRPCPWCCAAAQGFEGGVCDGPGLIHTND
jgi:hypothetical protein